MPHDMKAAEITTEREATLRRLLKRVAKRTPPGTAFPVVPFGKENDANREFAKAREGNPALWFVASLAVFLIVQAISTKIGAI